MRKTPSNKNVRSNNIDCRIIVKQGRRFSWNWVWLGLFGIGIAIFLIVTPKYHDDYWFMWGASEWYASQNISDPTSGGDIFRYGIPWDGIRATVRYHVATDNGRLCNIAAPFLLLFPKWVISTVATLFLFFAVWGGFRIAQVDIRRSWLTAVGIGLWVLTFYWSDYMGSFVYQLNYIVSAGLAVAFLYLLKEGYTSRFAKTGIILLAVVLSLWHEGFSVPLLVSVAIVTACFKSCRNIVTLTVLAVLAAGLIWHFGFSYTGQRLSEGSFRPGLHRLSETIRCQTGMLVAFAISIVWLFKFGWRRYIADWLTVFLLTSIAVSFGLAYFSATPRAATWGEVCSIILTLKLLGELDVKTRGYSGWRDVTATVILLISGFQLAAADAFAIVFSREMPILIANFRENPGQAQFSQIVDYPWMGLPFSHVVPYPLFRSGSYFIAEYFDLYEDGQQNFRVVPESLRHVSLRNTRELEGNAGFRKFRSYLLKPCGPTGIHYIDGLRMDYECYALKNRAGMCVSFRSEGDGMVYNYVMPFNHIEYELGELRGVSTDGSPEPLSDVIGKVGRRESLLPETAQKYRYLKP